MEHTLLKLPKITYSSPIFNPNLEKSSIEYTLELSEILLSNFSDSFEEQAQKIVTIIKINNKFLINSYLYSI